MTSATPQSPPSPDTRQALLVSSRKQQVLQQEPAARDFFGCLIRGVGMGTLGLPASSVAAVERDALLFGEGVQGDQGRTCTRSCRR
jgi:hypothetical protein